MLSYWKSSWRLLTDNQAVMWNGSLPLVEIAEAKARSDPYQFLAARLAAKEAFMKAIGTGWTDKVDWLLMEIRNHGSGHPFIELSGSTKDLAENSGVTQIHVSMSHTPLLASAFVVLGRCSYTSASCWRLAYSASQSNKSASISAWFHPLTPSLVGTVSSSAIVE